MNFGKSFHFHPEIYRTSFGVHE